jgi:hypothetical protein
MPVLDRTGIGLTSDMKMRRSAVDRQRRVIELHASANESQKTR